MLEAKWLFRYKGSARIDLKGLMGDNIPKQ